jgi:hypothetical protein
MLLRLRMSCPATEKEKLRTNEVRTGEPGFPLQAGVSTGRQLTSSPPFLRPYKQQTLLHFCLHFEGLTPSPRIGSHEACRLLATFLVSFSVTKTSAC